MKVPIPEKLYRRLRLIASRSGAATVSSVVRQIVAWAVDQELKFKKGWCGDTPVAKCRSVDLDYDDRYRTTLERAAKRAGTPFKGRRPMLSRFVQYAITKYVEEQHR